MVNFEGILDSETLIERLGQAIHLGGRGGHLVCIFTKLITKFEFVGARKPEDLPSIFKECDDHNDGGGPMDQWTNEPMDQWTRNSCDPIKRKTHWNIGTLKIGTFEHLTFNWHQLASCDINCIDTV